jgi:hypothetical protein
LANGLITAIGQARELILVLDGAGVLALRETTVGVRAELRLAGAFASDAIAAQTDGLTAILLAEKELRVAVATHVVAAVLLYEAHLAITRMLRRSHGESRRAELCAPSVKERR